MNKNSGFHLALYAHWSYFQRCVQYVPLEAQFLGHFGTQRKAKFWSLGTFSKCFHRLHILIASSFRGVWNMGPRDANFCAILGLEMNKNSGFFFQICEKVSNGFTSVLHYMFIGDTLRDVYNVGLKAPIFGPFWHPKYFKILVFDHFLKKFSLVSHQYCFTCSLEVLFRCVENLGLRSPFLGSFWASK